MNKRDLTELTLLAALWGASFLFIRLGAADFGPVVLAFVRAAGAALLPLPLLLPLLLVRAPGWPRVSCAGRSAAPRVARPEGRHHEKRPQCASTAAVDRGGGGDQRNLAWGTVLSSPGSEPMYLAIAFSSAGLNCFTWPVMIALPRPTCGLPCTL